MHGLLSTWIMMYKFYFQCGKVLCHRCSSVRFPLMFLDGAEARVCWPCKTVMIQIDLGYMDKTLEESFKFMQVKTNDFLYL